MLTSIPLAVVALLFLISAMVVWIVGTKITQITDIIDARFHLSEALGGIILLAIVTNLPEIAIVIGASLSNNLPIATGNILGGIAIQTVILVILDIVGLSNSAALTQKPITLQLVLEGLFLLFILFIVIMGSQLPKTLIYFHFAPAEIAIVITWIISIWLTNKAGKYLPWQKKHKQHIRKKIRHEKKVHSNAMLWIYFLILATVILIAGLLL